MAEIVLSVKGDSEREPACMAQETLESILANLAEEKHSALSLHCDWSNPPHYYGWLIDLIKKRQFPTRLFLDSFESFDLVKDLVSDRVHVEIALSVDDTIPEEIDWSNYQNISFFLPLTSPSPGGLHYKQIIDQLPAERKVNLGVNWKNRLSGPSALSEKDYPAWSETIISLIDMLSKKKVMTDFACGLKLCMLNRQQLGQLPKKLVILPISICPKSFFYTVDGTLQPCMRLELPKEIALPKAAKISQASALFDAWLMPYGGSCYETDNFDCRSLKVGSCQTGCIQHSIEEWQS